MSLEDNKIHAILEKSREFSRRLSSLFVGREKEVEQMIVAAIAQEPLLFIGPPGTAKSELVLQFKNLLGVTEASYFEYTLTKFTEPSEILGPLDLQKIKSGQFYRKIEGKLPTAELVFLDEIFKSNSAILNTMLTILNEKKFYQDGKPQKVPLKILFAATNEIPLVSELDALKDRFTLKVQIQPVSEDQWDDLIMKGLKNEGYKVFQRARWSDQILSLEDLIQLHGWLLRSLDQVGNDGADPLFSGSVYLEFKRILKTIRHDYEVQISDRKIIKLYKMIRAMALFKRGGGVEREDLSLLVHLGNQLSEIEFLRDKLVDILS